MLPIVRIFGLTIQTPLLAIMLGIALASSLASRQAERRELDGNVVSNALFYGLIAGVLGARLGYVLLNIGAYARDPLSALALNTTALSPWTGWGIAIAFATWYVWQKGVLRVKLLDALAPAAIVFAIGLALADFLSGSAYGTPSNAPWAVNVWNATRHPVQVYEAVVLAAFLVLLLTAPRGLPDGSIALLAVALYAFVRILVDGYRADVALVAGLRVTQLASVVVCAVALWLLRELLKDQQQRAGAVVADADQPERQDTSEPPIGAASRRPQWPMLIGVAAIATVGIVITFGTSCAPNPAVSASASLSTRGVDIKHVHWLGYAADGRQLRLATHVGLMTYEDGKWRALDVPANDYTGYSPTDDGFYTSGHPPESVYRPSSFGLMKSTDGGRTLLPVAFDEYSHFHIMAAGFKTHMLYIWNDQPREKLRDGLSYSLDDGKTWQYVPESSEEAEEDLVQIAAHPTDARVIALARLKGVFISQDNGRTLERIGAEERTSMVAFSPDGARLYFGERRIRAYDFATRRIIDLPSPAIADADSISNVGFDETSGAVAVATYAGNVFVSTDRGANWRQIARQGIGE